jgi:DNA helicase IV
MTVVGDLGQATGVWSATSWDEALANLPARRAPRVATLTVNYRTPAEVMAVAERVLAAAAPNLVAPRPVRSVGEAPVVTAVARHELAMATAAAVAREAAEVAPGKVGVVAPDDLVDRLADAIGPDLARSGSDAAVLDAPVAVLPLRTVKGLEFDSVVVVEPARLVSASPHGLRGLYVALTRTTRRLHVVHAEPLPPALAEGLEPAAQVATATTG